MSQERGEQEALVEANGRVSEQAQEQRGSRRSRFVGRAHDVGTCELLPAVSMGGG
jgi:hypothetical protein